MKKVLDRGRSAGPECKLIKNSIGLYDLRITDAEGAVIVDVKNVYFSRAVGIIEENMYADNRVRIIET